MIATGGLLRMNRRQDSQRSKNHAENQRKRKQAERKKKNDVVVVKGKLNLCSPPGLVATVGVVVLMLGIAMAVLGYWPHEGHSQGYASRVSPGEERRGNGRMSYSKSPLVSASWNNNKDSNTANQTVGELMNQTVGELTNQTVGELTNQMSDELTNQMSDVMNGSVPRPVSVNRSVPVFVSTSPRPPSGGFLSEFLDSYLYSDNLKVFGPLVMGIGIFLFICANAVLHENRDQMTKVINLRDIYSTVIDLHSTRTNHYSPINGLANYVQSRGSVDIASGSFNPGKMLELGRSPWPSTTMSSHQGEIVSSEQQYRRPSMAGRQRSWSRDNQTFTESVYSIYRDQKRRCSEQTPYPRQWDSEQASYPRQWDSEQASYPRQWDSEQASYPRQWDSEKASYPRQWDSEQASYPMQWDSEQASYPRQWDSEQQASYPRQWEGTASIVSSSFNAFTLPIITLNNCAVEEGGQAEREKKEIVKVKDFSGNGIEEEQVAGYSQSLGTTENNSSRRTSMNPQESYSQSLGTTENNSSRRALMNPQESYSQSLGTTENNSSRRALMNPQESYSQSLGTKEKDSSRRASMNSQESYIQSLGTTENNSSRRALMNPQESYSQSLGTTEKDSSRRASMTSQESYIQSLGTKEKDSSRRTSMNPQESYSQSLGTKEKDSSRRASMNPQESYSQSLGTKEKDSSRGTSMNPQENKGGTVMTLTEPDEALQGQTLSPQGSQLFPPSPIFRAMMGMGSRLSLNSLSSPGGDQPQSARRCSLTVAACRQGDRARRFSCTRLERSNSKGYIKLETMDGDSFEAPDVVTSCVPDSNQGEEVVAEAAQGKRERVTVNLSSSLTEL